MDNGLLQVNCLDFREYGGAKKIQFFVNPEIVKTYGPIDDADVSYWKPFYDLKGNKIEVSANIKGNLITYSLESKAYSAKKYWISFYNNYVNELPLKDFQIKYKIIS